MNYRELLKDKKYEVLYLLNAVDEFVLKVMQNYNEKNFKSVTDGDLDLESVEEKEAIQKKIDDNKLVQDIIKAYDRYYEEGKNKRYE